MHAPVPTLLLTRPKAASGRFAALIRSRLGDHLMICASPLMEIRPTSGPVELGAARGLIFTSVNGVQAASAMVTRRDLPVFCVGQATCQTAKSAGWNAIVAGQDADSLIDGILALAPQGPLLHLRGNHSVGDIAGRLSTAHLPTSECIVYDQVLIDLSDDAKTLLLGEAPVIVPLFSQRSAVHFVGQARASAPLYFAALSDAVAVEVDADCLVAPRPDALGMAETIEILVNQVVRVSITRRMSGLCTKRSVRF